MTINGTYQIRDLQIVNPTYEVVNVNDNLTNKTCNIEVVFLFKANISRLK